MYIGTTSGTVLSIENEITVDRFKGCGGINVVLTSILFDEYGYIVTTCYNRRLYLLFQNGTSTGKTITALVNPQFIGIDSNGYFILISQKQIKIYT